MTGLSRNTMTLREKQLDLLRRGDRPLTREEAARNFDSEEVDAEFARRSAPSSPASTTYCSDSAATTIFLNGHPLITLPPGSGDDEIDAAITGFNTAVALLQRLA